MPPIYRDLEVIDSLGKSTIRPGARMRPDGLIINPSTYLDPLLDELNLLVNPPHSIDEKTKYVRLARIWMPYLWRFIIPTQQILQDREQLRVFTENLRGIAGRGDFIGPQNRPYPIIELGGRPAYTGIRLAIGPYGGLIVGAVGFTDMQPKYPEYSLPTWSTFNIEALSDPNQEPRIS